jgi:glyoxylate/hydroxypyruvate reductase A
MAILLAADLDAAERAQWLALLREALPGETLVDDRAGINAASIDIAIVAKPPSGALQGLPGLRLIQSLWAGVDSLLRDTSVPSDVPLARMVDPAMNQAMAETALWAVLALHRGFFDLAEAQRAAQWRGVGQRRADEVAVVVLGKGQMGTAVAFRLVANGYRVAGWSTTGHQSLASVLADAEIVINLLPLTPATTGLLNRETFALMRDGASLVNLGRGAHVVDTDLLDALASGRLSRAVLDVFHTEPLPADHVFWSHPRITVLPHVAAQTDPRSAARVVAENINALRAGRSPQHLVDRSRGY